MKQPFTLKLMEIQHIPMKQFDGWIIHFVINGEVTVVIEGEKHELTDEDIIVVNPLEVHSITSYKDNLTMIMQIDKNQLEEMLKQDYQIRFECDTTKNLNTRDEKKYKKIKNSLIKMLMKYINKSSSEFDVYRQFFDILTLLSREFLLKNTLEFQKDQMIEDEKIKRIIEYISKNYKNQISLEDIANKEFLSYSYLSRYFKQKAGISFSEYLTKIRLQKAVECLRYSNDSIIKIAMKNGFSTSKAFYKQFKKYFGVSPAEYRNQNQNNLLKKEFNPTLESKYTEVTGDDALHKLSGFLVKNDVEDPYGITNRNITVDTLNQVEKSQRFSQKSKLINIGIADNLLDKDCTVEIEDIKSNLEFKYVRMIGFCSELELISNQSNLISNYNRNNRLFNYIRSLSFLPIIVIDQDYLNNEDFDKEIEELRNKIKHFIQYYGEEILLKWHFEFSFSIDGDSESNEKLIRFAKELKDEFHFDNIGIDMGDIQDDKIYRNDKRLIELADHSKMEFSFLGLKGDFYQYYDDHGEWISSNFSEKYSTLKDSCYKILSKQSSIFLTEWNTLVGDSGPLAGTFFRAALIVHTLDILHDEISCFGYWLNIEIKSSISKKSEDNCLSLFFYARIKRPAYFTLMILEKLRGVVAYKTEDTIVYKDKEDYHIIQYNSCLLEPKLSVSNQFIQYQTKTIDTEFVNLPARKYVVKSYLLDKDHGGIYNDWLRLGGEKEMDQEYYDYLETTIVPKYIMKYKTVDVNVFSLSTTLTMNAVKYIYIRPALF
ncbi:helix-turn-helix domain-containing protein [Clostridioides mangenotii]|uniref:helix-turn-helix domain-containing protein n=1 Tax=Metaclostridioides mangenotii TaxID=1540 RepID=UPI00214A6A32|nr:helix-turn-helix domain-containing protein [Clostridioides mangenotii]MCR1955531.1 helix-turn-helix domain-containing protein [Clostridioides mangenotii]